MKAITREEKIISGENLTPITRKEMFLAKAAGMDIETPEPITREEMFLSKIGGSGGGSAVLTELVVTENGVYDNPTIGGEPDFSVGGTVTFKDVINFDDTPEEYHFVKTQFLKTPTYTANLDMSLSEFVGIDLTYSAPDGSTHRYMYLNDTAAKAMGTHIGITEAGWYEVDAATFTVTPMGSPFSIVIEDEAIAEALAAVPFLFVPEPSAPADGWNKVIVDTPIVDVDAFPTENIKKGKIYRVADVNDVIYAIPDDTRIFQLRDGEWVENI